MLECPHEVEVDHFEEAVEKIRSHFRMEHPTRVFPKRRFEGEYEPYNQTLEEYFDLYHPGSPIETLTDQAIVDVCRRMRRTPRVFSPSVVQEAIILSRQHGRELEPYDPRVAEENNRAELAFVDYDPEPYDQDEPF